MRDLRQDRTLEDDQEFARTNCPEVIPLDRWSLGLAISLGSTEELDSSFVY
jgi:hypothetical protein